MNEHDKHDKLITIHIDRKLYKVEESELTGAQIRNRPEPPIGPDYDLYLEVPGGEDELIEDDTEVKLENGMHFFSTEKRINPGS